MSNEAWDEVIDQELSTRSRGEVTCGYTTHVDRFGPCPYCGAWR